MTTEITLKVNAGRVREAKRDLEWLNKSLKETESADISLGGDTLAKDAEMIRRAGLELNRLGTLARTGDNRGGFLDTKQLEKALGLSKNIGVSLGGWTAQTQKLRNELRQVTSDLKQLQHDITFPGLSPSARDMMIDDVQVLTGRRDEIKKDLSGRARLDARAGHMGSRLEEYNEMIGGFRQSPETETGGKELSSAVALLRRSMGYAAMLMGGASLLSVARNSWGEYHKQAEKESGLLLRGVRFERELSPWNYFQGEGADMALNLRRTTGAADMETLDRLQRFTRLSGIDLGAAMGFAGGYYQVTGADAVKQRQALDALLVMGKQAKDGRTEVLLQNINANLLSALHAQGGKALSDTQVSQVVAQTAAMYNGPGTQGMSTSMYDTLQKALLPGGDNLEEMLSWNIAGGFKKGPLTSKDLVEIQRRRSRGLNDPENRKRAMEMIRNFGGRDRNTQILFAQKILKQLNVPGGVETAEWFLDNYDRLQGARMPGRGDILADIAQRQGLYKETPAYDIGQRYAMDDLVSIRAGENLDPEAKKLQELKWEGKSLLSSPGLHLQKSKYDPLIQERARKYGINPLLLKSIIQEESGYNRFSVSSKGAKGLGQVMPTTGKQYGLNTDADFFDPAKNIDATAHLLADLQKEFGGDTDLMIKGYHSGSGNVRAGKIGPAARTYHEKVTRDLKAYSGSTDWQGWAPAPQSSEGVGLLTRIATTLDEIARKIGHAPAAPNVYGGEVRKPMPVRPR